MSKFGDKIKSVFTMDYNDEYDDDYYDDIDDEIEEEIDHPTPSRRSAAKTERHEYTIHRSHTATMTTTM